LYSKFIFLLPFSLIFASKPEAVFLVMSDPSMNEL
jgi:hypothetical protein